MWALGRTRSALALGDRAQGEGAIAPMKSWEARLASRQEREMYALDTDPTGHTAGQYARATVRSLRMRTLATLGALAVATALLGRTFGLHSMLFLASEIALLVSMFVISRFVLPLVDRHDRGATGEEQVGSLLENMSERGWRVMHDANFGRGNIDHILIGPPGIFTIETKSHPGPVRVARVHGETLRQAQAQQRAIERVTGLEVEALVVFSRAWVDKPMARRKGVRVLPARIMLRYLSNLQARLSPEEIERAQELVAQALREHHAHGLQAAGRWRRARARRLPVAPPGRGGR